MLREILAEGQKLTDAALERLIPPVTEPPASIHLAMRHSVFAGGKRIRPILCMEAGRMIAGSLPDGIEEVGAALEMLHTYSLIHDDLPALDNDDLRRGRPTCHKVFGEALAILAGDALQTQAYEVLSRVRCSAEARVRMIEEIARGTGTVDGMIGGQVVDLARGVAIALGPQVFREKLPGWEDRDDKWMFPRSVIDEMARKAGATLTIYPIHGTEAPFRNYFTYMMKSYRGLAPDELPSWAAEILDRFDHETFSPQMLVDLALEGCIIFAKPKAA